MTEVAIPGRGGQPMNLTTRAIVIKPISSAPDPAAVAADLRAIADIIEDNPHLAAVIARAFKGAIWPLHAAAHEHDSDARAVMAETVRQLKPIATGPVEKRYEGKYFDAVIGCLDRFHLLRIRAKQFLG